MVIPLLANQDLAPMLPIAKFLFDMTDEEVEHDGKFLRFISAPR